MSSPAGQFLVQSGGGTDLGVSAAITGMGIIYLFEDWLEPHLASGALEPLLEPWWLSFSGPYLYYLGPPAGAGTSPCLHRLHQGWQDGGITKCLRSPRFLVGSGCRRLAQSYNVCRTVTMLRISGSRGLRLSELQMA